MSIDENLQNLIAGELTLGAMALHFDGEKIDYCVKILFGTIRVMDPRKRMGLAFASTLLWVILEDYIKDIDKVMELRNETHEKILALLEECDKNGDASTASD